MKRMIYIFLSLVVPVLSWAQERSLDISLDRKEILLGEQSTMVITMKALATDSAALPVIGDTLVKEVEVLSRTKVDTNYTGDESTQLVLTQEYVLTSFDSGHHVIKPLTGAINGDSIQSNPFLISVMTVPIDTAKGIYDIRGIAAAPFSLTEWLMENWYWFAIGIVLTAIIVIVALQLSKEKKRPVVVKKTPKRPPHEIALERLGKLEESGLWQQGKIKLYYVELTEILREYIEHRFHFPALEQTTDEIIQSMRHTPGFSTDQIDQIKRLLFLSDLVKFAKENPVGAENEANFRLVKEFILTTKPQEEAPKPTQKPEDDA